MDVHIEEVVASVTAVDGNALLSPALLGAIVRAVLAAQQAAAEQRAMRDADRQIDCPLRGDHP